jgi:hypothetical protein
MASTYRGILSAGGAKDIYTQIINEAKLNNTYVFPANPEKYLSYGSPDKP